MHHLEMNEESVLLYCFDDSPSVVGFILISAVGFGGTVVLSKDALNLTDSDGCL